MVHRQETDNYRKSIIWDKVLNTLHRSIESFQREDDKRSMQQCQVYIKGGMLVFLD